MNEPRLGVALVGAGPDHWSALAHIPALGVLEDYQLRGVVTSNAESASAAAERWGVAATHELKRVLDDEKIDVVVVTVRVPNHAEIAGAAIEAGKHVYCEWPLAVDLRQARDLAALSARYPDAVHVTGLQGRFSPELRTAGELLAAGTIGRPLTASLRLFVSLGLVPRPAHRAHLRDRAVGGTVLSIQAGHALDMVGTLLGPPSVLFARLWTAVPEFVVAGTGERLPRDAPDNLVASLRYGDVVMAAHVSQTGARDSFELEILGTEGILRLYGGGQPQASALTLTVAELDGDGEEEVVSAMPRGLPPEHPGANVQAAYTSLAGAIRTGERHRLLPDFDVAVALHELLDQIATADREGR